MINFLFYILYIKLLFSKFVNYFQRKIFYTKVVGFREGHLIIKIVLFQVKSFSRFRSYHYFFKRNHYNFFRFDSFFDYLTLTIFYAKYYEESIYIIINYGCFT